MKVLLHCGDNIVELGISPVQKEAPISIALSTPVQGHQFFTYTGKADGLPIYHPAPTK